MSDSNKDNKNVKNSDENKNSRNKQRSSNPENSENLQNSSSQKYRTIWLIINVILIITIIFSLFMSILCIIGYQTNYLGSKIIEIFQVLFVGTTKEIISLGPMYLFFLRRLIIYLTTAVMAIILKVYLIDKKLKE